MTQAHAHFKTLDERRAQSMFALYENAVARACAQAVQPDAAHLHRIAKWADEAARIIHAEVERSCVSGGWVVGR